MKVKYLLFTVLLIIVIYSTGFCQDNIEVRLPEDAIARLGKGGINIMRFSPDGTRLAVGTDVGVWLYDVPAGKESALFTERVEQVNALTFSQDGKMLASGGSSSGFLDPEIRLWDVNTNSNQATFMSTGSPAAFAFSQDNTTLTCIDGLIYNWHVDTGRETSKFALWNGDTSSGSITLDSYEIASISQDGSRLATGTREGQIRLYDTKTGIRVMELKGPAVSILALAFSPDGKIIASGNIDNTVQLWDTEKGIKLATLLGHLGWVTTLAFSADGKTLASGDANKAIKLWDVDTFKERETFLGHKNTICALTFMPDVAPHYSGCLASGSYDGTIRFWDQHTGKELVTFTKGHTESVNSVAFSEDGTKLTTVAFNGIADVWDLKTKSKLVPFIDGHCDSTNGVALSSYASYFARRGSIGFIVYKTLSGGHRSIFRGGLHLQLWNLHSGEEISGPWEHVEGTKVFTFSPDNNMFVASIRGESIIGWHRDTGVELFRISTGSPYSGSLTFSPNGQLLASNGHRVKTRVWDITTQRELTPPNTEKHSALAFSPDGTMLALALEDLGKGIDLWNITSTGIQEQSRIIHKNLGYSGQLIFSPDGKIILNTQLQLFSFERGVGYVIKLWDTNGNDLQTLSGHTDGITTLVFSPDGKTLASGSGDGTVLLWNWEKIISKVQENRGN